MSSNLSHFLNELFFKCIYFILVGKTSLITRFMYDSFDNTYQVRSHKTISSVYLMCV